MAVDKQAWFDVIKSSLSAMADESFQRTVWFGRQTTFVSSPDEVINQVLGDAHLSSFVDSKDFDLSNDQKSKGKKLLHLLDRFCRDTPTFLKPEDVIDDPRWIEIRHATSTFLGSIEGVIITS